MKITRNLLLIAAVATASLSVTAHAAAGKTSLTEMARLDTGAKTALHGLPTFYFTTPDGSDITSRDVWKDSTMMILVAPPARRDAGRQNAGNSTPLFSGFVKIKSRGHSTFNKPKKPFTFKMRSPGALLGIKAGKRWILLANFMDHSNIRNALAMETARLTSLDWTPDGRFVNVVVNNEPRGCYYLIESIEVEKQRLNLDHKKGFLVECDTYDDGQTAYTAIRHLPLHLRYPEVKAKDVGGDTATLRQLRAGQLAAAKKRFDNIENLIYNGGQQGLHRACTELIDMDSFADWLIVHEVTQNAEPNGPRSCYFHDRGDGRLRMGPAWDFDLAFINVGLDAGGDIRPSRFNLPDVKLLTGDSLYNVHALWYDRLFKEPLFRQRLKSRWQALKPRFKALADTIDVWKKTLTPSAAANDALWGGQDPARFDTFDTFSESIDNVKRTYLYRLEALDKLFNRL